MHILSLSYDAGLMPVKDGFQATRELRAMGVNIPIIAVTGNALQEDKELFMKAGVDAVLTKPLQIALLKQTLVRYLRHNA
jgi:CheY-like chemotaxis protein